MKKFFYLALALSFGIILNAQKVAFEEFDLDNGLHVILHQDNTAPLIVTSVLYHVGSKDEDPERTGFAHFLSIYSLKELKILNEGNGLNLFLPMEVITMPIPLTISLSTMRSSLPII